MRRRAATGESVQTVQVPRPSSGLSTQAELVALAIALNASRIRGLSRAERTLADHADVPASDLVRRIRSDVARGDDPLGAALSAQKTPAERRVLGATYTPAALVSYMIAKAADLVGAPARVVDPGSGSGRFIVAAGRRFPNAELIACELDPVAALLTRAHLACAGLAARATVHVGDYRELTLAEHAGTTLFLGNPPYVRHHGIDARWKNWFAEAAQRLGLRASRLAGLHAHFLLATALLAKPADAGVFVTSAEWLDVNYGSVLRGLLCEVLELSSIDVLAPSALPFPDVQTTACVTSFRVGAPRAFVGIRQVRSVEELHAGAGMQIARATLRGSERWSKLGKRVPHRPENHVELGELCSVHRGQVTGANRIWIAGPHSIELPAGVLFPAVTRARELFAANGRLTTNAGLRSVIDLPVELELLPDSERKAIERFLRAAKAHGGHTSFVARHRKAWWSVGLRKPAPILATYMARRAPAFVRNVAHARHINVAHGLYPRTPFGEGLLDALAQHLNAAACADSGRTYAGGLIKFEPREMERIWVPEPRALAAT